MKKDILKVSSSIFKSLIHEDQSCLIDLKLNEIISYGRWLNAIPNTSIILELTNESDMSEILRIISSDFGLHEDEILSDRIINIIRLSDIPLIPAVIDSLISIDGVIHASEDIVIKALPGDKSK